MAIHEEHHLDICMGDKEIYISRCLYLPTHSYVKKKKKCNRFNIILQKHFFPSLLLIYTFSLSLPLSKLHACLLSTGTEISLVLFWLPLLCDLKWSLNPFVNIYWWDPQALWVIPLLRGINQWQAGKGGKGGGLLQAKLVRKFQKAQEPLTKCQTFQILDCFSH